MGSFDLSFEIEAVRNSPGANLLLQTPRHQHSYRFQNLLRSKANYLYYITMEAQISTFRGGISVLPQVVSVSSHTANSIVLHFVPIFGEDETSRPAILGRDIGNSKKKGNPDTRICVPKFHF